MYLYMGLTPDQLVVTTDQKTIKNDKNSILHGCILILIILSKKLAQISNREDPDLTASAEAV